MGDGVKHEQTDTYMVFESPSTLYSKSKGFELFEVHNTTKYIHTTLQISFFLHTFMLLFLQKIIAVQFDYNFVINTKKSLI